jgi:hypothetical protein
MNLLKKRIKIAVVEEEFCNDMEQKYSEYSWQKIDNNTIGFSKIFKGELEDHRISLEVNYAFQLAKSAEELEDCRVRVTINVKTAIDGKLENSALEYEKTRSLSTEMAMLAQNSDSMNLNANYMQKTSEFLKEKLGDKITTVHFSKQ